MGRLEPDEIVERRFAWGAPHSEVRPYLAAYLTRAEATTVARHLRSRGWATGPIARHVTRAPWMAKKGKEKK